jgi:hypothetical protein
MGPPAIYIVAAVVVVTLVFVAAKVGCANEVNTAEAAVPDAAVTLSVSVLPFIDRYIPVVLGVPKIDMVLTTILGNVNVPLAYVIPAGDNTPPVPLPNKTELVANVVTPKPPLETGKAEPDRLIANVPVEVIGLPVIFRNAGTLTATDVTAPAHDVPPLPLLVSTYAFVPAVVGNVNAFIPSVLIPPYIIATPAALIKAFAL